MHALLKQQSIDPAVTRRLHENSLPDHCNGSLSPHLRKKILYAHVSGFDWKWGGRNLPIKYLDRDMVEYSLSQAAQHDENEKKMALRTLSNATRLIDPHSGAIHPFSTSCDWQHPFPSTPVSAQAGCLRLYALAHALFHDHRFFNAARSISARMLAPADRHGAGNRSNNVVRDSGWSVEALAACYEFTGLKPGMRHAITLGNELLANYCNENGAYRAGNGNYFLAENLAMARAMLQLYRTTLCPAYLFHCIKTARFITDTFKHPVAGFITERPAGEPALQIDENICCSRFFNLLGYYTGDKNFNRLAKHGMKYLSLAGVATARDSETGILLLDEELSAAPVRICITGGRDDPVARRLYNTAMKTYGWYKLLEWRQEQTTGKPYCVISSDNFRSGRLSDPRFVTWTMRNC